MTVSIVTPSFRSGAWLKLCIASVADQGSSVEHIVQDAGSDDGTLDWLPSDPRVVLHVEKDSGMYDAINRGLRRSSGEILGWLNCDEQYLPGTLGLVIDYFQAHPEIDLLFGDVVMTNSEGEYLWHRKMLVPLRYHTWTCHLSTLSCAMFFRRRVVFDLGFWFDPHFRDAGDGEWMLRLLRTGLKMAAMGRFVSAFTQTGANMSAAANARQENAALARTAPWPIRAARPFIVAHHRVRRWTAGIYRQRPFSYDIYTRNSPDRRQTFSVTQPRFRPPFKRLAFNL